MLYNRIFKNAFLFVVLPLLAALAVPFVAVGLFVFAVEFSITLNDMVAFYMGAK